MVQLSDIDTSDRDIAASDFNKGYSPGDLTWAYEALQEVVLPAVAAGYGAEYFRDRDLREGGRTGTRSYADTFTGFFGHDAIRLHREHDKFVVENGYHRIWVARQSHLNELPARVPDDLTS